MTVMSSLQTRALFHIYIIIKSNFGVLNDFWCNGDFGFGMVSGERQRAARREGAREPHGAKNAPPNHEHQIDHHTLNLIIMIYIISYTLKSFFVKIFHWKIISFSILCFTQIESLTNNDGYFNTRLRPQNSNFRKISTQEPLSPKEIPIDKIKKKFIMRNDQLKYLDKEKSLEAAESFLGGNFKVVRKFKLDFF